MLPFLPKRKQSSVVASVRPPIGSHADELTKEPEEPEHDPLMLYAAEMILSAIERKDAKDLCTALKMHFLLCEQEPHEESEQSEEDPYVIDEE